MTTYIYAHTISLYISLYIWPSTYKVRYIWWYIILCFYNIMSTAAKIAHPRRGGQQSKRPTRFSSLFAPTDICFPNFMKDAPTFHTAPKGSGMHPCSCKLGPLIKINGAWSVLVEDLRFLSAITSCRPKPEEHLLLRFVCTAGTSTLTEDAGDMITKFNNPPR